MDQDERLMEMMDVIDAEVDHWKRKKHDEQQADAMKQNMMNNMGGKRA